MRLADFREWLDAFGEDWTNVECFKFARHGHYSSQLFRRSPANVTSALTKTRDHAKPRAGVGDPPTRERSFVRGFGGDLFEGEERIDPEGVERVQHQERNPEIGKFLNEFPARGEKRDEIEAEKQEQPRADAGNEGLRAIVGEKSSCQSERKKRGREQKSLQIEHRDCVRRSRPQSPAEKAATGRRRRSTGRQEFSEDISGTWQRLREQQLPFFALGLRAAHPASSAKSETK